MSTAAARVSAFLDQRAVMRGLDPEDIAGVNGGPAAGGASLTVADIRVLSHVTGGVDRLIAAYERRATDAPTAEARRVWGSALEDLRHLTATAEENA